MSEDTLSYDPRYWHNIQSPEEMDVSRRSVSMVSKGVIEEVWMRVSDLYDERWEAQYTTPSSHLFWRYGVANLIFLEYLEGKKHVLEVGCGTGGETVLLGEHVESLVATDVSMKCLLHAKGKILEQGLHVKVDLAACDGRRLPFRETCFDGLAARGDVFFHLVPQDKAVLEFRRVLREGSNVVLEMWNGMQASDEEVAFFMRVGDQVSYNKASIRRDALQERTEYYLKPGGELAEEVKEDSKFQDKGKLWTNLKVGDIIAETYKIVHHPPSCVFTPEGLRRIFGNSGFREVEVLGDGILSRLHFENPDMAKMMESHSELFFKLERELIKFLDPDKAPTLILRAQI